MGNRPGRTAPRKPVVKRNPVVRSATILRKGGAHGKSRKAERQDQKVRLKREIRHDRESPFLLFCFVLLQSEPAQDVSSGKRQTASIL